MTQGIPASGGDLRLATKVAWMYYEEGRKQTDIAADLHISQSRVSRLLKVASQEGIVRTVVQSPQGVYTELETAIARRYGLEECILVEARGSEEALLNDLGMAAASHLSATMLDREVIGISSWSATWLAASLNVRAQGPDAARYVVQLVGGVGDPTVQTQATLLLSRLARATGAQPIYFQMPGVLADPRAKASLMRDPALAAVSDLWNQTTIALLGIGSVDPSPLLRDSGTILAGVTDRVRGLGGVGDICFRYFDRDGAALNADVDAQIAGITEQQLRRVPRRIAAAGGPRKVEAIRAALRGGWVTTLITDVETAAQLAG